MSTIGERLLALHRALDQAALPHAFGGALALAWCTADPRGTSDIDVNVFVPASDAPDVVAALPDGVRHTRRELDALRRDGQIRLWWDEVPIDLFLNTTPFHASVATRAREEPFLGVSVPFLACADLAVFKAFINRTRDWADLEEMAAVRAIDHEQLRSAIAALLGDDDPRVARIDALSW